MHITFSHQKAQLNFVATNTEELIARENVCYNQEKDYAVLGLYSSPVYQEQ
jgi:hypothetical protein